MKKIFSKNEIQGVAREVLGQLGTLGQKSGATVLALSGNLGAGKTTLTQAIARELGISENVVSPTFVIMKIYDIPKSLSWKRLVHIDAYRLEHASELGRLGWSNLLSDSSNLILIEWPERALELIPKDSILISLSHEGDDSRQIHLT